MVATRRSARSKVAAAPSAASVDHHRDPNGTPTKYHGGSLSAHRTPESTVSKRRLNRHRSNSPVKMDSPVEVYESPDRKPTRAELHSHGSQTNIRTPPPAVWGNRWQISEHSSSRGSPPIKREKREEGTAVYLDDKKGIPMIDSELVDHYHDSDLDPHLAYIASLYASHAKVKPNAKSGGAGAINTDHVRLVHEALVMQHGGRAVNTETDESIIDALVATILSQNTTDKTSAKAFAELKRQFPTWTAVLQAKDAAVANAIKVGGLADIKAARIKTILAAVNAETGDPLARGEEISLEHMRNEAEWSNDRIKSYLTKFNGVGPKTVACVLMFCLRRPEFPVDTHVHRLSARIGWTAPKNSREDCYARMNEVLPSEVKAELHLLLVDHGKTTCRKQAPDCQRCLVAPLCATGRKRVAAKCLAHLAETDRAKIGSVEGDDLTKTEPQEDIEDLVKASDNEEQQKIKVKTEGADGGRRVKRRRSSRRS
eukprot:Clim_evm2s198 gene=Clim_evmTU2s198